MGFSVLLLFVGSRGHNLRTCHLRIPLCNFRVTNPIFPSLRGWILRFLGNAHSAGWISSSLKITIWLYYYCFKWMVYTWKYPQRHLLSNVIGWNNLLHGTIIKLRHPTSSNGKPTNIVINIQYTISKINILNETLSTNFIDKFFIILLKRIYWKAYQCFQWFWAKDIQIIKVYNRKYFRVIILILFTHWLMYSG